MLFNGRAAESQSDAGPLAGRLGGEKGVHYFFEIFPGYAAPVIANNDV